MKKMRQKLTKTNENRKSKSTYLMIEELIHAIFGTRLSILNNIPYSRGGITIKPFFPTLYPCIVPGYSGTVAPQLDSMQPFSDNPSLKHRRFHPHGESTFHSLSYFIQTNLGVK